MFLPLSFQNNKFDRSVKWFILDKEPKRLYVHYQVTWKWVNEMEKKEKTVEHMSCEELGVAVSSFNRNVEKN